MSTELEVRSLVDAVARAMRGRILRGEVGPGTAVTEKLVADEFSVARPTAKAAVEQLVADGLLRRPAHRSARVPELGSGEIDDLYLSRGLVERGVLPMLAAGAAVPAAARSALERFDRAGTDVAELVGADVAFHRALVDAVGSARLTRIHGGLMAEFHLCMAQVQTEGLLDPDVITAEHAAIVTAVEVGDADRAVAELDAHLENARSRIVAVVRARER